MLDEYTWPSDEQVENLARDELAMEIVRGFGNVSLHAPTVADRAQALRARRGDVEQGNYAGPPPLPPALEVRILEAWSWLVSEGYALPAQRGSQNSWYFISKEAVARANDPEHLNHVRARRLLGRSVLPQLHEARVMFERGVYDAAVMIAFKAVEVAVRESAQLGSKEYGANAMAKAFKPNDGALADVSADTNEQQAVMNLFQGAIGAFRNPSSHRYVEYDDVHEAAEIILFADLLLRIVDRASRTNSIPDTATR
jgi:uncharacterized protein (TIGR02391 family)